MSLLHALLINCNIQGDKKASRNDIYYARKSAEFFVKRLLFFILLLCILYIFDKIGKKM